MENLIIAEQSSIFSSFGVGFLAGFAFSVLIFLAFDAITAPKTKRKKPEFLKISNN